MIKKKFVKTIITIFVVTILLTAESLVAFCETDYDGDQYEFFYSIEDYIESHNRRVKEQGGEVVDYPETENQESSGKPSETSGTTPGKKPVKTCDHEYESTVTKEATCAAEGIMTFTCKKCSDTYTSTIPKTEKHEYESTVTKEASCTEDGILTFTCAVCGDEYEDAIPATGHSYIPEVTKAPSCLNPGEETFRCEYCHDEYVNAILATGHTEGPFTITKEAGLFTDGEIAKYCSTCNALLETQVINSKYPEVYLYIALGTAVVIAGIVIVLVVLKRKRRI